MSLSENKVRQEPTYRVFLLVSGSSQLSIVSGEITHSAFCRFFSFPFWSIPFLYTKSKCLVWMMLPPVQMRLDETVSYIWSSLCWTLFYRVKTGKFALWGFWGRAYNLKHFIPQDCTQLQSIRPYPTPVLRFSSKLWTMVHWDELARTEQLIQSDLICTVENYFIILTKCIKTESFVLKHYSCLCVHNVVSPNKRPFTGTVYNFWNVLSSSEIDPEIWIQIPNSIYFHLFLLFFSMKKIVEENKAIRVKIANDRKHHLMWARC